MARLHAPIVIGHRIQTVNVLRVGPVVLLRTCYIRHHVHVGQGKVNVDRLLPECRVNKSVGVESLQMYHKNWWQLRDVEFLDCVTGRLAVRAVPTLHPLAMKVHVEALAYMTAIDIAHWKFQT